MFPYYDLLQLSTEILFYLTISSKMENIFHLLEESWLISNLKTSKKCTINYIISVSSGITSQCKVK